MSAPVEMTAVEAANAMAAFQAEIGQDLSVMVMLSADRLPLKGYVSRSRGGYETLFRVEGDTFADLFAKLNAKWTEHSEVHDARMVRNMALAIIRITAEMGDCTDASLRSASFSQMDLAKYGERACVDATEIASNGPFKITTLGGANSNGKLDEVAA